MKTLSVAQLVTLTVLTMTVLMYGSPSISHAQDAPETVAQFNDRSLAIVVRRTLGLEISDDIDVLKIPIAEFAKLTTLSAGKSSTLKDLNLPVITDLTGLEHATQLRTLYLRGNDVLDITPLAELTQLIEIDLWGNRIIDISPLAKLAELRVLNLGGPLRGNEITDITPLAQLTQLRRLGLGGNQISDITPLANLTLLTELDLGFNQISDITPIEPLTQMSVLTMEANQISDITPIAQLTQITLLGITTNQIRDITPLAELTQLKLLYMGYNQIRDLTPLAQLASLESLWGSNNQIRDVTPLGQLEHLETLKLSDNQIRDATPLKQLADASLTKLDLRDNQIRDVSPLASLVYLEELQLRDNPITDTYPLSALLDENPNIRIDIEVSREESGPTVTVSTLQPLSAATLNGGILILTLSSGEFETIRSRIRDAVTISAVAGITFDWTDIEKVSDTEVRIKLTFDGAIETDTTLTVTVGSGAIKNYTGPEQTAEIPVSASTEVEVTGELIASTTSPLTKATLDGSTVTLSLRDKSYELGGSFSDAGGGVSVLGVPGVTVRGFGLDIFRLNDTQISVRLNFGGDFDDDRTLTFLVSAEVIANYSGPPLAAELPVAASAETPTTPQIPISGATLKFFPSPVQSPAVGEQLTLSLNIADGENVAAYQATVQYDDSALRYISSAIGDFLPAGAFPLPVDESGNTVTLGGISLAGESDGDGTLATITFEVIAVKASTLKLSDVLLSDSSESVSTPQVEDGQILEQPQLEEDVNGDGVVNILDLVRVASNLGRSGENGADVNGDGVVNILDLVRVAGALGNVAAAPSADSPALAMLTTEEVKYWLAQAQTLDLMDATSLRGVLFLEQLLASLTPRETALLPNYPNPFNPETWIPYQLAEDATITLAIYDSSGRLVRRLNLGHRLAGYYADRGNAAYWDGHNEYGEQVASGVYFYRLSAGTYSAMRKMLIRK